MLINKVILAFFGLCGGFATAAGLFAFVVTIGVLPRIIGKSNTAKEMFVYDHAILLGGLFGTYVTMVPFFWYLPNAVLILPGLCFGIYVGCLALALEEMLNALPIFFRRAHVKKGLEWYIIVLVIGKAVGALYYFYHGMAKE